MICQELIKELSLIAAFPQYETFYKQWLNQEILDIASEIDLPDLALSEPVAVTVHDDVWLYDLPKSHLAWKTGKAYVVGNVVEYAGKTYTCIHAHTAGAGTIPGSGATWDDEWEVFYTPTYYYQKKMFKVRDSDMDTVSVCQRFEDIESSDPDHDDTETHVTKIGIKGERFAVYPMADDTLYFWFYRKPTPMVHEYDKPDGIPEEKHSRVIIPRVVVKNFEMIQKMAMNAPSKNLLWWQAKKKEGMISLATFLILRDRPPRRHGGRDPLP